MHDLGSKKMAQIIIIIASSAIIEQVKRTNKRRWESVDVR